MKRIGIAKGRGLDKCIALLGNPEVYKAIMEEDRLHYKDDTMEVVIVRGADLAYAAKNNFIDIAIGSQLLFAENIIHKMQYMGALPISDCRLSLIGKADSTLQDVRIVGTRYPRVTVGKLNKLNLHPEIMELSGCLESWLLNDSCDAIVDVIKTGNTIALYNFKELVRLAPVEHGIWLNNEREDLQTFVSEVRQGKLSKYNLIQ
ncbi:hypothetical protein POV27_01455 [Aureisphaera galaxeae]|uniref:hypothetical protein n=1 Tax=Aureisphaera galaxeae TaxID=1538023 RepID=UPI0023506AFD|nr:hypothetical protein [Aureisphaera galaxeae]MDC8002705.1 hypothetical protein [Aureisphaera galaxeae]